MFTIDPPPLSRIGAITDSHAEEDADLVDIDNAAIGLERRVLDRPAFADPGVVYQDVEPAPARNRIGYRLAPRSFVGYIQAPVGGGGADLISDGLTLVVEDVGQ